MGKVGPILALTALMLTGCGDFEVVGPQEAPGMKLQNPGFEDGAGQSGLPQGWFGTQPGEYEITVDEGVRRGGKASARIKSVSSAPQTTATLTQCFDEIPKGVSLFSLSGFLKVENVASLGPNKIEAGAGLWTNVMDAGRTTVASDNMNTRFGTKNPREANDRRLYGSLDWNRYTVSVDLPEGAARVCFGFSLSNAGTAWGDDIAVRFLNDDGA